MDLRTLWTDSSIMKSIKKRFATCRRKLSQSRGSSRDLSAAAPTTSNAKIGGNENAEYEDLHSEMQRQTEHTSFHALSDDVLVGILSFISYAPYEWVMLDQNDPASFDHNRLFADYLKNGATNGKASHRPPFGSRKRSKKKQTLQSYSFGTLTHVLPLVCRRFRNLCNSSDVLWSQAMQRLAMHDPTRWKFSLNEYTAREQDWRAQVDRDLFGDLSGGRCANLVSEACAQFQATLKNADGRCESASTNCGESTAKLLFKYLAENIDAVVFTGGIFWMKNRAPPRIGMTYRLHLFDPLYRRLIQDVMKGRTDRETSGALIGDENGLKPRPRFLYSYGVEPDPYSGGLGGDPVLIVELTKCNIYADGRADVSIVPISHAMLSDVWVGDNRGLKAQARTIPSIRQRRMGGDVDEHTHNVISAPMIRMFSSVAPQLGIEFSIDDVSQPHYTRMLGDMMSGRLETCLDGHLIPYPFRPLIVYTCQPDRWMPLGEGVPGEDAFVMELRMCRQKQDMTYAISAVPIQLGKIVEINVPLESEGTQQPSRSAPNVKVQIRVVLKSHGPTLV